jgi:hypothetical protein
VTLLFPDVSEYTPNVDPAKYPILIARATLSDRVSDPTYAGFKAKAAKAGTLFLAYHWLNHGNLRNQAKWCFQHVGSDVPLMIDAEDVSGNTGYAGPLTVDDIIGFADQYRTLGGICSLVYLPFWYWSGAMGAPRRLGELAAAGLGLVSSNYPKNGYTENGPGWAGYYSGAPAPVQWQYTSTPIDMNAFRGTVDDFAQLAGAPRVLAESVTLGERMFLAKADDGTIYLCDWMRSRPLHSYTPGTVADLLYAYDQGTIHLEQGPDNGNAEWVDADATHPRMLRLGWSEEVMGKLPNESATITDAQAQAMADRIAATLPPAPSANDIATAVNDEAKVRRQGWN